VTVAADDREGRPHAGDQLEPEQVDVERDGLVGVAHQVSRRRHGSMLAAYRTRPNP
jgi:hypothetical protein